jgi:hypothetical protein
VRTTSGITAEVPLQVGQQQQSLRDSGTSKRIRPNRHYKYMMQLPQLQQQLQQQPPKQQQPVSGLHKHASEQQQQQQPPMQQLPLQQLNFFGGLLSKPTGLAQTEPKQQQAPQQQPVVKPGALPPRQHCPKQPSGVPGE